MEIEGRVVFSFGVNDAAQEVDPVQSLTHAEAILSDATARWPAFMVGLVPIVPDDTRERSRKLDAAFADLCMRLGVPYLSVFDGLMETSTWLDEARAGDGAHPGAGGYARLAELVLASAAWRGWMDNTRTP